MWSCIGLAALLTKPTFQIYWNVQNAKPLGTAAASL